MKKVFQSRITFMDSYWTLLYTDKELLSFQKNSKESLKSVLKKIQNELGPFQIFKQDSIENREVSKFAKSLISFEKNGKAFFQKIPILLCGTEFEKNVWKATSQISFGETSSYGKIAQAINKAKASRAVGNALNKNPLSLIVPCHRVLAQNRKIGGFALGVQIKKKLLLLENSLNQL